MKHSVLAFAYVLIFARIGDAGSLAGSVRGADGSIIAGVVTASREPGLVVSRLARTSASTAILPDGTFQFPPLADGAYRICVQAPGTAWLNSCEWGQDGNIASVSASKQPSGKVSIVLRKGALVTVRVNDPSQVLGGHEGKTPGAHLLIGVNTDSRFFREATITSKQAASRTYQVLIPFDRNVNLSVASALFQLKDETSRALPPFGNLIPVFVASGQAARTVVLNVGGIAGPR
jgi:hypothetical protein